MRNYTTFAFALAAVVGAAGCSADMTAEELETIEGEDGKADSGKPAKNEMFVFDNGIRCITAPCPSLTEQKLNSNLSANITGVDFEPSGASQDKIDLAQNAMFGGDGLVVVGYRDYDSRGGKTRTANKFFTKAPVPLY